MQGGTERLLVEEILRKIDGWCDNLSGKVRKIVARKRSLEGHILLGELWWPQTALEEEVRLIMGVFFYVMHGRNVLSAQKCLYSE